MTSTRVVENAKYQMDDILRPLNDEELDELMELYKSKYSSRNFHYLLMYNQRKWDRQLQLVGDQLETENWNAFRKTFYTHRNSDFRKHGTYVSLHWDLIQSVFCNSWQPSMAELKECLSQTKLIKWLDGPLLANVELPFCEEIKRIAVQAGTTIRRARRCQGLILPQGKASQLKVGSLPDGYVVRTLRPDHAEQIHALWPNNKEGSLQYVRGLISLNKTLGVFRVDRDKLVAWIFQNDYSGLGILQVLPDEQRRGFGSVLAAQLSMDLPQSQPVEVSAWIVEGNFKSEKLFQKIGFEKYVVNEWIQLNKAK